MPAKPKSTKSTKSKPSTAPAKAKARAAPAAGLTIEAIRRRIDPRSFERGREYFEMGAIRRGRRVDNVFKARCVGQHQAFYRVWAKVERGKIVAADCTCYVGEGGHCKHVAALLLTLLDDPARFVITPPLAARLAACDQSQLVELVLKLVERAPRQEGWVERWLDK